MLRGKSEGGKFVLGGRSRFVTWGHFGAQVSKGGLE